MGCGCSHWLLSLGDTHSGSSTHLFVTGSWRSYWCGVILPCLAGPRILCPRTPEGHLGGSHVLAVLDKAAVDSQGQVSLWAKVLHSLGSITRHVIAGQCGKSVFSFVGDHQTKASPEAGCAILPSR